MRKVLIALASAVLLSSCGTPTTTLYYWGGYSDGATAYEHLAYKSYDKQSPQSICGLVAVYENMVSHPGGSRQKSLFGSTDYSVLFRERGQEMLEKEIEYYPESAKFIEPLIKKLAK